jgi:hypothetical protein
MNNNVINVRFSALAAMPLASATRRATVSVLAVVCLAASSAALAQNVAGVVKASHGNVQILREGRSIPAPVGTDVMAGDTLRTVGDSSTGVMLKDDTRVALGPNSQLVLDRFAFNANTNEGDMLVSILKGTLRMVSGLLVKANPEQVRLKTPTATIGVRGTDFIVDVP